MAMSIKGHASHLHVGFVFFLQRAPPELQPVTLPPVHLPPSTKTAANIKTTAILAPLDKLTTTKPEIMTARITTKETAGHTRPTPTTQSVTTKAETCKH